jgi:hypothetical protein
MEFILGEIVAEEFPYILKGIDDPLFKSKVDAFLTGQIDKLRYKEIVVAHGTNTSKDIVVEPGVNNKKLYVIAHENTYPKNPEEEVKLLFENSKVQFNEIREGSSEFHDMQKDIEVELLLFDGIGSYIAAMKDDVVNFDYGYYLQIMNRESFLG